MSNAANSKGFFGHPRGLSTLFFTEMWERFSFYGMRAILFLYMTAELSKGGLGWTEAVAGPIYGLYASSVYFLPLIGGWIADRFIGAKRATLVGGIIIMFGHFSLAFATMSTFYLGLLLVAVGTGFLKSNISAMVGGLYDKEDQRRDSGFSIFYMAINIGAFLAPIVCGFLAQTDYFKYKIESWGFNPNDSWHFGFAAAGVGMLFGIVQYVLGRKRLEGVGEAPIKSTIESERSGLSTSYLIQMLGLIFLSVIVVTTVAQFFSAATAVDYALMPTVLVAGLIAVLLTGMQDKLSIDDWKRVGMIILLFTFSMLFWMGFEQAATSLNSFAEKLTDRNMFGWEFPASWLQSVNAAFIVLLAPVFSWLWLRLGKNQPTDSVKFVFALFFGGVGFVLIAFASSYSGFGKVSWYWLAGFYFFQTVGELCLSPVGLSSMTKLAPAKMVSLMLGVWFLSISMGNYFAGLIGGKFVNNPDVLFHLFGQVAMILIGGAFVLSIIAIFANRLLVKSKA